MFICKNPDSWWGANIIQAIIGAIIWDYFFPSEYAFLIGAVIGIELPDCLYSIQGV